MAHCWEENIIFSEKKLLVVVNRGGPEGVLPRVALSFSSSSLITDWIRSDEWWRGVRGGWGVDRTCSQSCPSLQNVRKTRDCCVWATTVWAACCGGGGKGGRTRKEEEGGRRGGQRNSKTDLKRTTGDFVADFYWKCMFHSSLAQTAVLLRN